MKYKVFKTVEERIKSDWIAIKFLTDSGGLFYFSVTTFIADGGIGLPPHDPYRSFHEAEKAAYHCIITRHSSPKQREALRRFNFIKYYGQPGLFDGL